MGGNGYGVLGGIGGVWYVNNLFRVILTGNARACGAQPPRDRLNPQDRRLKSRSDRKTFALAVLFGSLSMKAEMSFR